MIRVTDPWNSPILKRLAEWRWAEQQRATEAAKSAAMAEHAKTVLRLYDVRDRRRGTDASNPNWIHV